LAVAGQQRLGRAHLGAQRQLTLRQAVGAVFRELLRRTIRFGSAGTVGALVHLSARAEVADPRVLRRAERAGIEAIAAANAEVLGMQDHCVGRNEEAIHGTYRCAGRVSAVHARHGDRALARLAVIDGDDPPAVDAPGYLIFVLTCSHAGVALDAALGVTEEFHSSHGTLKLP